MEMKAPVNTWQMTARGDRIDWSAIRDRIDLAAIATALLGPAPGRRGERGRRLWWPCPFHDDKNPSLCVTPGKRVWRCFGCGEHGDAADLAMRLKGWPFPEAVRWLAEQAGMATASTSSRPRPPSGGNPTGPRPPAAKSGKAPAAAPGTPSGLPLADALSLVTEAAGRLWTPEGANALAYLHGRGLTDETIKAARLGWTPGVVIPIEGGVKNWRVAGVVIPWLDGDRLAMVKIRRIGSFKGRKYIEAYRDRPGIFPGPAVIEPGKPLVVTEGEFDALLLGQAIRDLAAVVTLGSASAGPEADILGMMLAAAPWYIATDADDAGDRAASGWPTRAVRVRPPVRKDWTEAHQYGVELGHPGVDLARWWTDRLGGTEAPELFTWPELSTWRWGDAVGDPDPGIVIHKPDRGGLPSMPEAAAGEPSMQGTLFPTAPSRTGAYP